GIAYIKCDGLDILDTYRAARQAADFAREQRRAVFLHMTCVRLYGHAGSDVQAAYMTKAEVQRIDNNDPLLHSAGILADAGALTDLMLEHANIVLAGEDIGPKGGVYGVTTKLHTRFGPQRVINTLLDEQSILGLGIGLAHNGFLPMPEIQFLAYLHNAEDQLRGEAATLSFFSNGQYTNPMIVRIAGLGYQKGFGGHFHNDNI